MPLKKKPKNWLIYRSVVYCVFMFLSLGRFLSDVVYCPRLTCGAAVIQEKSGKAAMCSVCGFAFCVTCRKTYHGTESCQFQKSIPETIPEQGCADLPTSEGKQTYMCSKNRLEENSKCCISESCNKEKSHVVFFFFFCLNCAVCYFMCIPAGIMALWNDYTHGSKQRKTLLEKRYGQNTLRRNVASLLTDRWKTVNTKNCPHCFCSIQVFIDRIDLLMSALVGTHRS